eukprot:SAG31_NODE_4122_length_3562_cov_4.035230_4_plen_341_part_00
MLRRMATILRNTDGIVAESFEPHAPVAVQSGVYASAFINATHTLWTVVNRDAFAKLGEQLEVPCESDDGFWDLYRGTEFVHSCDEGLASLAFELEPAGFGAVLKSNDGQPPPADLLAQLAELSTIPLAEYSDEWAPLQQSLTPTVRTSGEHQEAGMVDIPSISGYVFESSNNCIEGDELPTAVGVQMPWEDHPRRHHSAVLDIESFFIDITPVTNEQYAAFLIESGYAPSDAENFLRDWTDDGTYPEGWESKPVRWVSRNDAQVSFTLSSGLSGQRGCIHTVFDFILPTGILRALPQAAASHMVSPDLSVDHIHQHALVALLPADCVLMKMLTQGVAICS